MGCIGEPYTAGHPRIAVPAYMLLQGYSWGEAASASTPYLAWNTFAFGDPLYQPFASKELVVDTDAPQPGPVSIVYHNRTGVAVAFSLQGIDCKCEEKTTFELWKKICVTGKNSNCVCFVSGKTDVMVRHCICERKLCQITTLSNSFP